MKEKLVNMAVIATFVATAIFLSAVGNADSHVSTESIELPAGTETPRGAACDLIRSYLNRDFSLYRERRYAISCETSADVERDYGRFMKSQLGFNVEETGDGLRFRPTRIERVFPARRLALSDAALANWNADLFFNYGALSSVVVGVLTVDDAGQRFITQVESMQLGTWNPKLQKLVPADRWRARIRSTEMVRGTDSENTSSSIPRRKLSE